MLLTVGHGTLAGPEFVALVVDAGVRRLVDVRRHPGSRRHPQFGRDPLAEALEARGVGYRWEEALGGRRAVADESPNVALRDASFRGYADHMTSAPFRAAVADLLATAAGEKTAVMCAESVWWRCHRRLIADHLTLVHGVPVEHLLHDGRRQRHVVTDGARTAPGAVVYDGGATPPLSG